MALVFNMGSQARLAESIEAADTRILLTSYDSMLGKGGSGDSFYARMINAEGDIEIVLVDVGNSDSVQGLSVTRGVESTSAKAWGGGTIIWQVLSEASLDPIEQKAISRQVAYIPDGALVSDYFGEKVYQANLQMWWKSVAAATTEWRLIAGKIFTADVVFAPSAGAKPPGTTLTMSCITPSAIIYYTDDGTDPDETDTLYTAPILLPDPGPITYKAKAFGAERYQSPSVNITSGEYSIVPFSGVFQELFEQTRPLSAGFDNVNWTITGNIPDEIDADALSSVVGSPDGWGTQCLKVSPEFNSGQKYAVSPEFTPTDNIYVRFEVIFTSVTFPGDNYDMEVFRINIMHPSPSYVYLQITQDAGVMKFEDSGFNKSGEISLDTLYRIEYHTGADGTEWRINGATLSSSPTPNPTYWDQIHLGITNSNGGKYTAYFDKVTINDTGWIGA